MPSQPRPSECRGLCHGLCGAVMNCGRKGNEQRQRKVVKVYTGEGTPRHCSALTDCGRVASLRPVGRTRRWRPRRARWSRRRRACAASGCSKVHRPGWSHRALIHSARMRSPRRLSPSTQPPSRSARCLPAGDGYRGMKLCTRIADLGNLATFKFARAEGQAPRLSLPVSAAFSLSYTALSR